jgi:tRNA-splicing ligase RtcB
MIELNPNLPFHTFHKNILAEDEHEIRNLDSVMAAMNSVLDTPTVLEAAIMPDACPVGKDEIPVGGVVATWGAIHPRMHSADVCCSVMATDLGYADPKMVLDFAQAITHFGIGGRFPNFEVFALPENLKARIEANPFLNSQKSLFCAQSHLGTQGDGNHFLFVGRSKNTGRTMLVTHHGSRGFGANLYKEGVRVAESFLKKIDPKVNPKNAWIPADTQEGHDYWEALQIVRCWTKYNHIVIHDTVEALTGADCVSRFWNEHNFVFRDGNRFYHAKGATPMCDKFVPDSTDGLRLIPLNMGQPILIAKAVPDARLTNGIGFAPHGAGRNFSRTEHKRTKLVGKSVEEVFAEETAGLDVRFYSGKIDVSELPSAYKDAEKVKDQIRHFNLATIVDEIMPYGCIMAGEMEKPWQKKKESK